MLAVNWLRPLALHLPMSFCESSDGGSVGGDNRTTGSGQVDAPPLPVVCAECAQYNTFAQRLQWAHRDERCRKQPECTFVGLRMTGNCINADSTSPVPSAAASAPSTLSLPTTTAPPSPTSSVPPPPSMPASLPDPMQLVNDQIQDTLSTTLRSSRSHAEELAKSLVIANLQATPRRAEFGRALGLVLSVESVRLPTRGLVYWSLKQPLAVQAMQSQASWWTRYFLHPQVVPCARLVDFLSLLCNPLLRSLPRTLSHSYPIPRT